MSLSVMGGGCVGCIYAIAAGAVLMIISREFLEGKKGAYSQRKIPPMMQNERDLSNKAYWMLQTVGVI